MNMVSSDIDTTKPKTDHKKSTDKNEATCRRFLVVVDDSPEMTKALHYAARRAMRSDGKLVLLYINDEVDFQHWLGLEALMEKEMQEIADAKLQEAAMRARQVTGEMPELVTRTGARAAALIDYLKEDHGVSIVVLGAGITASGPGQILSHLFGKNAPHLSTPITVVPGDLSFEDIDHIT